MTTCMPKPSNQLELVLYRVLERANLLQYYDTFIAQGGDDMKQLCEAGEEEFLEIMALVGMSSKPLHVRRLQKSLQEWASNPIPFQQPLSISPSATDTSQSSTSSILKTSTPSTTIVNFAAGQSAYPMLSNHESTFISSQRSFQDTTSDSNSLHNTIDRCLSPSSSTPKLSEYQACAIAVTARRLVKTLPTYHPKPLNMKKPINQQIMELIAQPEDTPTYFEQIRKYSAIYGRFDSKRSGEKPMTLHEVSVNEAAAYICFSQPALLTRREELFPLARNVVRDSGYQYTKGHSRSHELEPSRKRSRFDTGLSKESKMKIRELSNELDEVMLEHERLSETIKGCDENMLSNLTEQLDSLTARRDMLIQARSTILLPERDHAGENGKLGDDSLADLQQKTTLFDEGLRIALQYGMEDLASELIGLNKTKEELSKTVEQESSEFEVSLEGNGGIKNGKDGRKRDHTDSDDCSGDENSTDCSF